MTRLRPAGVRYGAALATLAVIAAACGGGDGGGRAATSTTTAEKPVTGGTLRFATEADVSTLDPSKALAQPPDIDIALAIYDPLMTYDETGKIVPFLARSMTPNADLTEWTMTLPTGVTFQDATPFNSDAVVNHLKRQKEPATACTCSNDVKHIVSV